ncbi:unnamed protein product [Dibothriocephalus latus]|uniref:Uncharacterized protein n=1 Tax=Dibothriocephalus latus TaxID=60516 RepID=A0A3P7LU47_DIBLA|nr:unnamed protein product [Dibothriocephalus latus]
MAEWCLYPENEVFQRIHAGIVDPVLIGDKPKWFRDSLVKVDYAAFEKTDVCVVHLGCCKNRDEWALEHVSLNQLMSIVEKRVPLPSANLPRWYCAVYVSSVVIVSRAKRCLSRGYLSHTQTQSA